MDVTILNTNLDAVSIVDTYESFIWTDRYYAYGDFELYEAMREGLLDYINRYVKAIDREIGLIKRWRQRDMAIKSRLEKGNV